MFVSVYGIRWHAHALKITSSQTWVYLEVRQPDNHVFEDYFGAPRDADAQEITTSRIWVYLGVFQPA